MSNIFSKKNEPIVIVNKDFKRCLLYIIFPIREKDAARLVVLKNMAFDRSMNYNTDKKIFAININNYCLSYRGKITTIGNNYFLELQLFYPSTSSLGKDVLEDNLKFIKDIVYNPYLENGTFPEKQIADIISIIKNNIARNKKNPLWYYFRQNTKTFDENDYLSSTSLDDPSRLDSVTSASITKLYQDIIKSSPLVFLIGNVSKEDAKEQIERVLLNNKKETIKYLKEYHNYCRVIPDTPTETIEKAPFKTSGIAYNYKVKNLTSEKDIALLKTVGMLLDSSSSRLLFDTMRIENDLVYRCGATVESSFGSLTIYALTGKENIDKVKQIFDNIKNQINNLDFISEKFNLILEDAKLNDLLDNESIYSILMNEIDKYIECREKNNYEVVKDITPLQIKEFIDNRLILVSKYIGVGEENE